MIFRCYYNECKNFERVVYVLFSNKDLRKLIVPLILEQTLAITVGMADTVMVSSVGEAAISGVSLVDMFNNLIISVLAALATGGAVVTSQFLGAKREGDACRSARQLILTETVITIFISVLVIIFCKPLLRLFFGKIEQDVMKNAITYLIISALSFPLLAVYDASAALFRAMGNSQITFKVSVLMNIINVAGNAFCIYVLGMGVEGVAIPSLVSRGVAGVVMYVLLKNPKNIIHITKEKFKVDFGIIKRILYIGIPSGVENGIFQLGRVVVVSIIAGFGTVQIAANGVANSLDSMGCIIGQAMNLAMISVIGRCAGALDEKQIRYYTKKLLIITYLCTIVMNSTILIFLNPILSVYSLSEETMSLAYKLVMIHNGGAMLLWPLSFVLPNMLRACNDVRYTMIISIFSMFAFRIGFSYIFGVNMDMGAIGVWYAMLLDWIFRVTNFVIRYFKGNWKRTLGLE